MQDGVEAIKQTNFLPQSRELENQGFFQKVFAYGASTMSGTLNSLSHGAGIVNNANEVSESVTGHASWIQKSGEDLRFSLRVARMPFTMVSNTLKFSGTIGAANVLVKFVFDRTIINSSWIWGFTLATVEEYHNLYPNHIPSFVEICKLPVKKIINVFKK